ncbi:MAG: hypothetical protein E6Y49_20890, partial [Clostridium sporogenes]|nr:hypothetical protein [Clostridium sporogenes]
CLAHRRHTINCQLNILMNKNREELLEKDSKSLMFKLCIPAILGILVIGLYSSMDGIFARQLMLWGLEL